MGTEDRIFLIKGNLTWKRDERVTDRYGTINLQQECPRAYNYIGQRGRLVVKVLGTREITHLGDFFRGIYPSIPEIDDEFVLGEGEFFTEEEGDSDLGTITHMGLKPDDNRSNDWLDPHQLYKVHNQYVSLWFEPENGVPEKV